MKLFPNPSILFIKLTKEKKSDKKGHRSFVYLTGYSAFFSLVRQQLRWILLCSAFVFACFKIVYILTGRTLMKIDQSKGLLFPCLWNILKAAFLMDDDQSCF